MSVCVGLTPPDSWSYITTDKRTTHTIGGNFVDANTWEKWDTVLSECGAMLCLGHEPILKGFIFRPDQLDPTTNEPMPSIYPPALVALNTFG